MPAHNSGQRKGFGFVGNQEHVNRERALLAVQSRELFTGRGAPNDNGSLAASAPGEPVAVKRVERLAGFEHHEISHIHHVVDAAQTDLLQSVLQPVGAGPNLHAADHARGVTGTKLGVVDADGD